MLTTANLKLKKPEGTDVVNIDDLNYNADIIDTEMAKRALKTEIPKVPVTSVNNKTGAVSISKSDVGLGNVSNDSQVKRSEMGVASGVATLDANGVNAQAPKSHTHNYAGSSSAGGSANNAVKLATARGLTIGNTKKNFDGSADVSWSLSEIGAASKDHTHEFEANLNIKNIYSFSGINYSIAVENIDFKNNVLTEIYATFRSGKYDAGILKINDIELINVSKTGSSSVKYCIAKIIIDKYGNYRLGYMTSTDSTVYFETAHNVAMMRDKKGKLVLADNNILSLKSDQNTKLEIFAYGG